MFIVFRLKRLTALILCAVFLFAGALHVWGGHQNAAPTSASTGKAQVPILMYHSILKDNSRTGEYVVTPAQLKNDLEFLQSNCYESVVMQDLIDYVNYEGELPEKPVIITFDDGHLNNIVYAQPLLAEYGMRAVISVVGEYSERSSKENDNNPAYSYVTWEQITQTHQEGVFEIQNHSYTLHSLTGRRKGTLQVSGESFEAYNQILTEDLGRMQQKLEECTGSAPSTFTYPFGLVSKNSEDILRGIGFQATLTCEHGINTIEQGNPETLYGLKRIIRSGNSTTRSVMQALKNPQ